MKKHYQILSSALRGVSILIIALLLLIDVANGQTVSKSGIASNIPDTLYKIFEKSCMTCHSEGGKKIAMSHLNFSNWNKYNSEKQAAKAKDICEMVTKGKMPPKASRESKPDLIPTADQLKFICQWSVAIGLYYTVQAGDIKTNNEPLKQPAIQTAGKFEFKPLPFAYEALEPYIDKQTVELHYTKHHKSAFDAFVAAVKGTPMEAMDIKEIFRNVSKYPVTIRNNGGSYYNHMLYWENMKAKGGGTPAGKLSDAINKKFGNFEEFKKQYTEAGKSRYGSGYSWLAVDDQGELFVCSMPNQDNPLMDLAEKKGTPLLVMDVWEHAYYLKYQNRRADYIDAFWNVINWDVVSGRYDDALKTIVKK